MSALGQKQTLDQRPSMSALPPKADIAEHKKDVRFVPKADIRTGLFDHLVGAQQNRCRHINAQRLCGAQIDSHVEFRGFQNG